MFVIRSANFVQMCVKAFSYNYLIIDSILIIQMIAFTSARKRMSVLVEEKIVDTHSAKTQRVQSSKIKLYIKGADNIILSRLEANGHLESHHNETLDHIKQFAEQGLRTLCLAHRDLTQEEYRDWQEKFNAAKNSLTDREDLIERTADLVRIFNIFRIITFIPPEAND